jgi:hypothetical protein
MVLVKIKWDGVDWPNLVQNKDSEYGNELSGSIKCWEIFVELSDCWLLQEDSAPVFV